ncbi:MAG: DUF2752 domain-containing protein [Salinimicrobium sp.]
MEDFMLPCLNKMAFGMECPGCGAQRAFVMVFQGKFVEAFHLYPAIYPILALLFFLLVNLFIKFKYEWQIKVGLIILNATIIIAVYLYKISFIF